MIHESPDKGKTIRSRETYINDGSHKSSNNCDTSKTAVELLFDKLWDTPKDKFTWYAILEQAKEMGKQQIIDAYKFGLSDEYVIGSDKYYNSTYGSKGSDETKEYPYSHIYETIGGKYGLSSYNEHDQTDGIFNTYQEAVDFGLSLIKLTHTSSQTTSDKWKEYQDWLNEVPEISDEEIEKAVMDSMDYVYLNPNDSLIFHQGWMRAIKWYREQLKKK